MNCIMDEQDMRDNDVVRNELNSCKLQIAFPSTQSQLMTYVYSQF